MTRYTNSGLVQYCKDALKLKTIYMWGGLFREVTNSYIEYLSNVPAYKNQYPKDRVNELKSVIGKDYYGCDCVGLIKSYYFGGVGIKNNAKGYGDGSKDVGVGTMYQKAITKGKISTMPKKEGVLVMTSDFGHVGVYVGENKVIECTLSKFGDGVVQTLFTDRPWAYWCQCPFIENDTGVSSTTDTTPNLYSPVNSAYRSLGVAAIRNKPTLSGTTVSHRCVKGDYYLADRLYLPDNNGQKWFRHTGQEKYSALTDTNGASLFEFCGTYTAHKTNAVVNVRSEPSLNSAKVTKLTKGVTVYTTGKTSTSDGITWLQVIYQGKMRWCDRRWIG